MNAAKVRVIGGLVVAILTLVSLPTAAQESRGTISGRVLDTSKAVVPGATVSITNVAMNTTVTMTTNETGFFQAPYLIPGTYRIVAELSGFKRHVRENVPLRIGDTLDLELVLDVGGTTEAVTVTAETTLLETSSASLGQVIDTRRVAELPTPHGDPYALIGLAGGVSYSRDPRLDRPFEPTHIVGFAMDGTRANRSDVTIDGVPMTATANAGEVISSYVPPQDLVAEFKVQTATFDASLGNTEGGVTNLSLKSGTNQLRGTAYFVRMPSGLFANDFFANANNVPLPDFTYNRWGATVGGPIIIPRLYDGRSKTFFMYGIEGINEARPRNNGTPTVPTAKMRTGDFSELLALGPQYQIYNPFTRRAIGGGRFQQDPFPGNMIPATMFDPVAKKILDFIAMPRTHGQRGRHQQFSEPDTHRGNYLPDAHGPGRSRHQRSPAAVRAGELLRPRQRLQQLLRQHLDRRVVPVQVARRSDRLRQYVECHDGDQPALRLQPVHPRDQFEPRQPRHGPDVAGLPLTDERPHPGRHPPVPADQHDWLSGHGGRRRVPAERSTTSIR